MKLLVTNPTNIQYLTGFTGEGWLVLSDNKRFLITDSRYTYEAKKLADLTLIASLKQFKTLEFEEDHLTVSQYNKLKKTIKLIPTKKKIENLRIIKRPDEIEYIRKAATLTKQCFNFIRKRIKPGVTETKLANELEGYLRFHGATLAFSPIVAFNEHSSLPHYSGRGSIPLRKGGMVLLDFGAAIHGYHSDMTRVVFLDKPYPAYDAVRKAQERVFTLLKKGERNGAVLDRVAKNEISKMGFPPYQHSLGHGVGLEIHEDPRLTIKKATILKPGMVFTIEPGSYIEGKYGVRLEDLVLLTKKGIEILT